MPLNRPTQAELLDAVAEYLRTPPTDPKVDGFLRRVAANVVSTAQREAEQGANFMAADNAFNETLAASLNVKGDVQALCNALSQGVSADVLSHHISDWIALAGKKLDIDNPKYPR